MREIAASMRSTFSSSLPTRCSSMGSSGPPPSPRHPELARNCSDTISAHRYAISLGRTLNADSISKLVEMDFDNACRSACKLSADRLEIAAGLLGIQCVAPLSGPDHELLVAAAQAFKIAECNSSAACTTTSGDMRLEAFTQGFHSNRLSPFRAVSDPPARSQPSPSAPNPPRPFISPSRSPRPCPSCAPKSPIRYHTTTGSKPACRRALWSGPCGRSRRPGCG